MIERITIPYAIADFAKLREGGYYYVDKTRFIPRLENYDAPTYLRPRRFGKSLYVSMLAYYYDIDAADRFEQLFSGTYIGSNPTSEHNKYMVLRLDFSQLRVGDTMGDMEENFNNLVCPLLKGFTHGGRGYPRFFQGFTFSDEYDAVAMLNDILAWIRYQSGVPQLYILIDEYDNATNQMITANKDDLYKNITGKESFFRTFFKSIKAGLGAGNVSHCFCTGVLPITIDDLTSGYNIAEFLSLRPNFIEMMGFTHEEAATYLHYVIDNYGNEDSSFEDIWSLLIDNYDGYRFRFNAQPLFNPTILTYFFKYFADLNGEIPDELIDNNLRTDIGWMHRLTDTMENAHEMLNQLVADEELLYAAADLQSRFGSTTLKNSNFYPIALFYLGMTTLKSRSIMILPNLTMRSIYMDYYNEIYEVHYDAYRQLAVYSTFADNRQLEPLVENFFEEYIRILPAQVFDKINENFVRCAFFWLSSRYINSYFSFAIEPNYPSGRPDLVMKGLPGTSYHNDCRVVEFKYFKAKDEVVVKALTAPREEDIAQVKSYAADINRQFVNYKMRTYVVYMVTNKSCRVWEV
ncbi:MAG: ATP-binding protein [Prevotellaceae bacterium]|jgi:hypothetical protein|nr:ATP-binding protein [Prevotellaceae bacterium]